MDEMIFNDDDGAVHLAADIAKVPSSTGKKNYSEDISDNMLGGDDAFESELEEMLYSRHVEVESFEDLKNQRGTPIPALFNQFYKFIQNPSSVSVETFKRMIDTDDTIGSGVDFLTTCLAARLGQYQHPNETISKFVNKALNQLEGGWTNSVKKLLSGSWAGYAVGEKIWHNTPEGFLPKKIAVLPPSTILFETDRVGEITSDGILQYQRNYNPALFGSGPSYLFGFSGGVGGFGPGLGTKQDPFSQMGDFPFPLRTANTYSYLSIRIPKLKCILYSFDAQGNFENPYGRSLLRRCHKYYLLKDAILQMLSIALDRKGTPLTVVYVDPNATVANGKNPAQGQTGQGANTGKKVGIRADLAAQNAFRNMHNDSTIILPGKKGQIFETDFVNQQSNATDFIAALDFCNKGIMRALLLPALVFTGGDGSGSYALGQEHAKTFDKILDGILAGFKQTLLDQLIKEILAYNFPEEQWRALGLGEFAKRDLSLDEKDKELQALESAVNMGAVDMQDLDDLNHVRSIAGFKPRTTPIPQPTVLEEYDEEEGEGGEEEGKDGVDDGREPGSKPGAKEEGSDGADADG